MKFDVRDYRILVVDDDRVALELYQSYLCPNYNVEVALSVREALAKLQAEKYHLVITDLVMPGANGLELIAEIKLHWDSISIIVISGQATVRTAVEAMKAGAEELIMKPLSDLDLLSLMINRSLHKKWLQSENKRLNELLDERKDLRRILGSSKEIQLLLEKIQKIAGLETTILLTGETGVGKSFFAEVIHEHSKRRKQKFVSINCGALTESLLESTLFGHLRGAFTGAVKSKKGLFEEADGGTLFLDEISETSGAFQVKLLNVLERGMIRNVGGEKEIKVDVRLIFATNRNLREEVEAGNFRKDLFFRINVINLRIPALRERPEDILMMASAFLREFCEKHDLEKLHFSRQCKELLTQFNWEGNIRELRNTIEHAAVMCDSEEILPEHLPENIYNSGIGIKKDLYREGMNYQEAKECFEKTYFENLLRKNEGNVTLIAKESNIARQYVYRKLAHLGLSPEEHRR
jgi:DNA-binding NtrC family response regulator